MHRIDGPGATGDGHWTEGNPGTGTPATEVTADFMNAVQTEIENVIVDPTGGNTPLNKANNAQLLAAIKTMIAAAAGFTTGDLKPTLKTVADAGWVMCNDGTIGSGASGATTRANADTEALYTVLWNNVADAWAPVTGGRGASAAADFAANKPIRLTKMLGRALAAAGQGVFTSAFTANATTDELTIDANSTLYTGQVVRVSSTTTLPAPLVAATDYWVIRTSATVIKLATSLANAHAGTAINITAAGTGTHTLTLTMANRALGETVGEEAHVTIFAETAPHDHDVPANGTGSSAFTANGSGGGLIPTTSEGGGQAHNNMQPTAFVNFMIKL